MFIPVDPTVTLGRLVTVLPDTLDHRTNLKAQPNTKERKVLTDPYVTAYWQDRKRNGNVDVMFGVMHLYLQGNPNNLDLENLTVEDFLKEATPNNSDFVMARSVSSYKKDFSRYLFIPWYPADGKYDKSLMHNILANPNQLPPISTSWMKLFNKNISDS